MTATAAAAAAIALGRPQLHQLAAGVPAVVVVVVVVVIGAERQHERGRTGLPLQRHFPKWPNGCHGARRPEGGRGEAPPRCSSALLLLVPEGAASEEEEIRLGDLGEGTAAAVDEVPTTSTSVAVLGVGAGGRHGGRGGVLRSLTSA